MLKIGRGKKTMDTWVCQFILECANGDVTGLPWRFLFALYLFSTSMFVLVSSISEPRDSYKDTPTPFGFVLLASGALGGIIVFIIWGVSSIVLNFEISFLLALSASIFALIVVVFSIVIRYKRWK